jgi:hypothetical protein
LRQGIFCEAAKSGSPGMARNQSSLSEFLRVTKKDKLRREPDRRSGGRKVDEAEVTGAAAAGPSLLGSVVGVEVRYGSFIFNAKTNFFFPFFPLLLYLFYIIVNFEQAYKYFYG